MTGHKPFASLIASNPLLATQRIQELLEANSREVERRRQAEELLRKAHAAQSALLDALVVAIEKERRLAMLLEDFGMKASTFEDPRQLSFADLEEFHDV
jgi:hypothetical protein